jgi:predicted metal-dependent phosphoesterase TrpH
MVAGATFTNLCRSLAQARRQTFRVDLHIHTTCSDGDYTPAQVVDLARRCGMPAVAITDHDTLAAIPTAQRHAGDRIEIIPGVEISTVHQDRDLHLLAYFVKLDGPLADALERLRVGRRNRLYAMAQKLRELGVKLSDDSIERLATTDAVGRRNLANLLVEQGKAGSIREAFNRYLGDHGRAFVPKERLTTAEAIRLVREAGGVTSWAHPGFDCTRESLGELYNLGMRAVEVDCPSIKPGRAVQLRTWAKELGLATTGGSDCHGPDEPRRAIGMCGVTAEELDALRAACGI